MRHKMKLLHLTLVACFVISGVTAELAYSEEEIVDGPIEEGIEATCEINETLLERLLQILFQAQEHAQRPLSDASSPRTSSAVNACGSLNSPMGHLSTARYFGVLSDVCNDITQQMKALVESLREEVADLVEAVLFDPTEYLRLMESVHEELINLDIIISSLNATHNLKVEELMAEFETQKLCYLNLIHGKLEDIRQMKDTHDNALVELIETDFKLDQFDDMKEDLEELSDNSRLQQVIENIYNIDLFEKMSKVYFLASSPQKSVMLEKWYEMMQKKSHLGDNNIIILRKLVRDLVAESGSQASDSLAKLQTKIDSSTSSVLDKWGAQIHTNNYASLIDFGSPATIKFIGPYFTDIVQDLVVAAYADTRSNLGSIMKFVFALRWNIQRALALKSMDSFLSSDQDKLFIALKTRQALGLATGPDSVAPAHAILEGLKVSFRQQVQDVIWHTACTLNSTEYGNTLYVGGTEYDFEKNHKRVFAWGPSNFPTNALFTFAPVEFADHVKFNVENTLYPGNLYLYKTDILDERYLVSSSNFSEPWRFEPESNDKIRLFNMRLPAYLYASPYLYSSTLRNVYLGYSNMTEVQNGIDWNLKCY